MKVEINNKEVIIPDDCNTLSALLLNQGISEKGHAIAVNNQVVPRAEWSSFQLVEGMKVLVIRAVRGG